MRVLLVHASAGAGHKRAAEAIAAAFAALFGPPDDVAVLDALDFAPPGFRRFYQQSFERTVRHAPWFYGAMFHASSEAARFRAFRAVRRLFNRIVAHELCDEVNRRDPDVVVVTHFLPLDALARRKKRRRLQAALACVVTDFIAHRYWVEPRTDRAYVATSEVVRRLALDGVARRNIRVTGIPVDPAFAAAPEGEIARAALGIDPARKMLLVLGGGLGMGPVARIVEALGARADLPIALEVVCGKNEALRAEVEALVPRLHVPARVHGFVTTIPLLMAASDLVVTKPGGLTTSEAIAVGRPLVLFEAMPGQEAGNAAHFVRCGAALEISPEDAAAKVARVFGEAGLYDRMAGRARELSRPRAAHEIAADVRTLRRRPFVRAVSRAAPARPA